MGDFGFKYSLPNKSALRNINPLELGYSSRFTTLKIFRSGKISSACSGLALTTLTVNHGLNYRPAFNAYYTDTLTNEYYQVSSGFEDITFSRVAAEISCHAKSNNQNIIFDIYNNNASSRNVDVYFDILIEDLTTEPQFFVG